MGWSINSQVCTVIRVLRGMALANVRQGSGWMPCIRSFDLSINAGRFEQVSSRSFCVLSAMHMSGMQDDITPRTIGIKVRESGGGWNVDLQ